MGLNLKEPVGPLPLGAWIAVVGGGLGISWYSRRHAAAPAPVTTAPAVTDGAGTFTDAGTGDVPTGGGSGTGSAPPPQTNDEWGGLAVFTVLGHGFDPLTADRAIRDYLAGNTLDASEKADIDAALRFIGPPPIPVPPPIPAPPGGDTTTAPPSQAVPPAIPSGSGFFTGPQSQLTDILARNGPPANGYPATVVGDDGSTYEWLSPTAEAGVAKTGELVYVQEAPRHFVPIGPWSSTVGLLAGTPIYLRIGG